MCFISRHLATPGFEVVHLVVHVEHLRVAPTSDRTQEIDAGVLGSGFQCKVGWWRLKSLCHLTVSDRNRSGLEGNVRDGLQANVVLAQDGVALDRRSPEWEACSKTAPLHVSSMEVPTNRSMSGRRKVPSTCATLGIVSR